MFEMMNLPLFLIKIVPKFRTIKINNSNFPSFSKLNNCISIILKIKLLSISLNTLFSTELGLRKTKKPHQSKINVAFVV